MGEGGVGFPWGGELQVVDMHVTENINAMTECKIHDQRVIGNTVSPS